MKIQSSISLLLSLLMLSCAVAAFGPVSRWLETRNARATGNAAAHGPVPLQARVEGENLRIVWDRNAALLREARGGSVTIEDGPLVRRIPLTGGQLRTSNGIIYVPQSALVKAELQVESEDNKTAPPSIVVVVSPRRIPLPTASTAPPPLTTPEPVPPPANQLVRARPEHAPARLVETAALRQRSGEGIRYYKPPAPTYAAKPDLPEALSILVPGVVEIDVQMRINARGEVTAAMPVSQTGSLTGSSQERALFARAVLEAARKWTFSPARIGAHPVPSEVVVSFRLSHA